MHKYNGTSVKISKYYTTKCRYLYMYKSNKTNKNKTKKQQYNTTGIIPPKSICKIVDGAKIDTHIKPIRGRSLFLLDTCTLICFPDTLKATRLEVSTGTSPSTSVYTVVKDLFFISDESAKNETVRTNEL